MTNNAWNTPDLTSDGEVLIGNGTNSPTATTLTAGANCTITNGAGSIQLEHSGGGGDGDFVLVDTATASSDSEIDFTDLSSTYFSYMIVIDNFVPEIDGDRLYIRTSSDNGVSYDSGASDYNTQYYRVDESGDVGESGSGSSSRIYVTTSHGSASNETASCILTIHNPSASAWTRITGFTELVDTNGDQIFWGFGAVRYEVAAVDAIRFYSTSGDIESASFRVYGMKSS